MRGHPRCKSATYRPSRNSFWVIRKDQEYKEGRVKDLKRKRHRAFETDDEHVVRNLVHTAVNELLLFLDEVPAEALDEAGSDDVNEQGPAPVADKAQAPAMITSDEESDEVQGPAPLADKAQAPAMSTSDEVPDEVPEVAEAKSTPDEAGSDDVNSDGPENNLICPLCYADNSEYYGWGKGTPFGEPCPQCPDEERYSPATLAARRADAEAPTVAPAMDSE